MWEKDGAFWNQVNDTWAEVQRTQPVIKVADSARMREMQKTVSELKNKPPVQPGKWPVKETIEAFLTRR
jgi:hypothetical protein